MTLRYILFAFGLCSLGAFGQQQIHVKRTTIRKVAPESMATEMLMIDTLDRQGHLTSWTTSALDGAHRDYRYYEFDEKGNWTMYVKSNGYVLDTRHFDYAENDSILKIYGSGPNGITEEFFYDENWNITKKTTYHHYYGIEETVIYTYDGDGRILEMNGSYYDDAGKKHKGTSESYIYEDGQLVKKTLYRPHFRDDDHNYYSFTYGRHEDGKISMESQTTRLVMGGELSYEKEEIIYYKYEDGLLVRKEFYIGTTPDHIEEYSYEFYQQ